MLGLIVRRLRLAGCCALPKNYYGEWSNERQSMPGSKNRGKEKMLSCPNYSGAVAQRGQAY